MERQDGHTWRDWRDHWLPRYLTPDAQHVTALTLTPPSTSPGLLRIRDQTLILPEAGVFDLTQYTLGSLATAITATGWTATLNPALPATLPASRLVDTGETAASPTALQDARQFPTVVMATSAIYTLLRPLAQQWENRWHDIVLLTLSELEGPWLDALGTYLQIPRIGGEPDSLYSMRLYGMAVITSPNGLSMETLFAALGYAVSIVDSGPAECTVTLQWPLHPPTGFVYTIEEIAGMLDHLKAVGVLMIILFASQLTDTLTLGSEILTPLTYQVTAINWGGTLADGTGAIAGFPWNETIWR